MMDAATYHLVDSKTASVVTIRWIPSVNDKIDAVYNSTRQHLLSRRQNPSPLSQLDGIHCIIAMNTATSHVDNIMPSIAMIQRMPSIDNRTDSVCQIDGLASVAGATETVYIKMTERHLSHHHNEYSGKKPPNNKNLIISPFNIFCSS